MVVVFILTRKLSFSKRIALSLLLPYIFLVFASTVFDRTRDEEVWGVFRPFRSYKEIFKGTELGEYLKGEVALNIIMLAPVGIFVPIIVKRKKVLKAALTALTISTTIEVLQILTKRGYLEFDDIFNNTLGAIIAALFTILVMSVIDAFKRS